VAVIPAGETKDPAKNFPFALLTALGIVAVVYILVQIVSIGTLPNLATSERPLADAASSFMGPIGAAFIVAGALVSILGNLNVGIFGASRIVYAMGVAKEVPSAIAATHPRFRTPYISIILNALIILFLTIQASFLTAVAMATITRLLVYATTCLSLIVFRRRADIPPAPFLAPFGILAAVLSLALIAWLLTNVDFSKEGLPILIAAVAGLVIYIATQAVRKFRGNTPSESI
jgi:basic amino acid/polyamine antiporter, APA family